MMNQRLMDIAMQQAHVVYLQDLFAIKACIVTAIISCVVIGLIVAIAKWTYEDDWYACMIIPGIALLLSLCVGLEARSEAIQIQTSPEAWAIQKVVGSLK